jgi:membrane protein required for colicin V production
MTLLDYFVLGIVGFSVLLSVWRGAVREVLALGAWVFAFLAGQAYAEPASAYMPLVLEAPSIRLLGGFLCVFLVVLLLSSLLAATISKLLHAVGLGPVDRGLGAIFGFVRGMLVVLILVLLGGLTEVPRTSAWRDAKLSAPLEAAAGGVKPFLPYELARRITFD